MNFFVIPFQKKMLYNVAVNQKEVFLLWNM